MRPKPYQKTNPNLTATRDFKRLLIRVVADETLDLPEAFLPTALRGVLETLWSWGFCEARDGDVTDLTADDVEVLTGWPGSGSLLLAALVRSGFITEEDERRHFNDWEDWGGALFAEEVREAEAARKAAQRERAKQVSEPVSRRVPECPAVSQNVPTRERGEKEGEENLGQPATSQPTAPSSNVSRIRHEPADFLEWWETFGKVGSRADAEKLYRWWREHGAGRDALLTAAVKYRRWCEQTSTAQKHGRTFLAKDPNRWEEWLEEEHGASGDTAAHDGIDRDHEQSMMRVLSYDQEVRHGGAALDSGPREDDPRQLAAGELHQGN